MTNAMIILSESIRLMEEGVLHGSGEFVEIEQEDGTKKTIEIPEEIHTFNGWKDLGYNVKKGEHSEIKFSIWKHATKIVEKNGEELEVGKMFRKVAAFFTAEQVEPTKAKGKIA